MNQARIIHILTLQRDYFRQGETLPVDARKEALRCLREGILSSEAELNAALHADLGKSAPESYLSETAMLLGDIRYYLRHLNRLAKARKAPLSASHFPASAQMIPCPRGCVLVIAPWNYPLLLSLAPAIAAIAAGNTVVIKTSEYAPNTARVLYRMLSEHLPKALCTIIPGAVPETQFLLDRPFDHIFFTGGSAVGRVVMQKAATHLTPITLELGGKSPCIVDATANLPLAARRIVFGKFLNCGQTCVAPDYLLVQESVREALLGEIRRELVRQYGTDPLSSPDYGRIVNQRHFDRLCALIDPEKLYLGGETRVDTLQIAPTILDGVSESDPIMQEEIFGPLLPVRSFLSLSDAIEEVLSRPHPLSLYLFSEDKQTKRRVIQELPFGGGCINDTILHLSTPSLPFGGVGESGMGSYHGKAGFDTFTHYKSVLQGSSHLDIPLRYAPYTPQKSKLLRHLLR